MTKTAKIVTGIILGIALLCVAAVIVALAVVNNGLIRQNQINAAYACPIILVSKACCCVLLFVAVSLVREVSKFLTLSDSSKYDFSYTFSSYKQVDSFQTYYSYDRQTRFLQVR